MRSKVFFLFFTVTFFQLHAQSIDTIKRVKNDSIYLDFINPFLAPIEINLKLKASSKSVIKLKSNFILHPKDTLKEVVILPQSKLVGHTKASLTDFITMSATFGDPNSVNYKNGYLYDFPFLKGKRYKIMQGFNGKFSHRLKSSKYAIDFDMKVGDTICAARNGIVIFTKDDSKKRGNTRAAMGYANKIIVMHEDGTFAQYVHLDYDGVFVNIGDQVNTGQPIGISGFTGFTTKPHLHFVLKRDKEISIPFYFKGYKDKVLKQKKRYGH